MKYALVTGGSRGIGRAICMELAKETDYGILINYNSNEDQANKTLNAITADGSQAELLKFDISNLEDTRTILDSWQEKNPDATIEVIVNNAGITKDGLMMWMKSEDWNSVIDVNLNGFFNVTQHLLQRLLMNRYGRIINIVSVSGMMGNAGQVNYAAAKGGVIAATKSLAKEVGKRNITVNAVAAGYIETEMTQDLNQNELQKTVPLNRFGKPEEVAHLVAFLASKKASYITGEVININGGIYS